MNTPRALTQGMSWHVRSADLRKSFHANIKTLNPSLLRVHLALPVRGKAFSPYATPHLMTGANADLISVNISLESSPDARRNVFSVTKRRSASELGGLWQWLSMVGATRLDMTSYSFKVLLTRANGRECGQIWTVPVSKGRRPASGRPIRIADDGVLTAHGANANRDFKGGLMIYTDADPTASAA